MVGTYRKECCGNTKIISNDSSVTSHSSVLEVQHCYSYCVPSYSSQWFNDEIMEASRPSQVHVVAKCCLQNLRGKGKGKFVPASTALHHSRKTHKSLEV